MKFLFNVSPNLKQQLSTQRIMRDLTIALLVVYGYSLIYYYNAEGIRYVIQALILMATSIGVTLLVEAIWAKCNKKPVLEFLKSSFGWITAIILTLMCPITTTPYALGVATVFAILFGKLVFGGFGQNVCNPAALGRAILLASFAGVTMPDIVTEATPTTHMATNFNWLVVDQSMIDSLFTQNGSLMDLFFGNYPGALGETCTALLLVIGVVLVIRKVIDWRAPVMYLVTIFAMTSGFAIFSGMEGNWLWYPIYHLCIGGVMFGAVFMMTDPVTTPTSAQGRIIFGIGAGIITVLIRLLGNLPEGCLYAILIMNVCTPAIEQAISGKQRKLCKKTSIISLVLVVLGMGSMYLASNVVEPAKPKPKEEKPVVQIPLSDEYVKSLSANIIEEVKNADQSVTYSVSAEGFAAKEGPNLPDYGHGFEPNVFDITIAADGKTIVSVAVKVMSDTEYIGDKIENPQYLKQFEGKDISTLEEVTQMDAVSKATYSVKSSIRALLEVKNVLGY